jgi:hypothetical protein
VAAQSAEELLKADHRKVEQLFQKFEGLTDESEKAECAKEICKELIVHTMLEEEIFYPACRRKGVKSDMLDEAQVEHDGAKVLIQELLSEDADAEFYDAKVSVLSEYIKHHVGEEEKGSEGIFALAKKAGVDMDALGRELQARKAELTQELDEEQLPAPQFRSLQAIESGNQGRQEYTMPRYESESRGSYRSSGGRFGQERDEQGRFMSDDDDRGYSRGRSSRSRYDEDDDRGYSSRGRSGGQYRERDDYGRFTSDDDDRRSSRYSSSGGRSRYDDDDQGRGRGQGGWFGDPEGHAEASRRGWESRSSGGPSRSSRYDDDDFRGSRSSSSRGRHEDDDEDGRSRGHSGWYGDSEGHAEAARRGWESRGGGSSRSSQSRSGGGRSRYEDDDDGRSHGGWFGDSRGHAEAARRGWRNRD